MWEPAALLHRNLKVLLVISRVGLSQEHLLSTQWRTRVRTQVPSVGQCQGIISGLLCILQGIELNSVQFLFLC